MSLEQKTSAGEFVSHSVQQLRFNGRGKFKALLRLVVTFGHKHKQPVYFSIFLQPFGAAERRSVEFLCTQVVQHHERNAPSSKWTRTLLA